MNGERVSDRLIAMRGGQVYAHGPAGDVLTHDLLRDVFGLARPHLNDLGAVLATAALVSAWTLLFGKDDAPPAA